VSSGRNNFQKSIVLFSKRSFTKFPNKETFQRFIAFFLHKRCYMKLLPHFFAFAALLFISSCGPGVTFEDPQPSGSENIEKFPVHLRGMYLSNSDSSILTVTDKALIRKYDFTMVTAKKDLDTASTLNGDTVLISKTTGERMKVNVLNDSIYLHFVSVDTFFRISESNVLRKMKGKYFLNYAYGDNSWSVEKMFVTRSEIAIVEIGSAEDIDKLDSIIGKVMDTTASDLHYKPTRRQFRKFVKQTGFSNGETFVKIEK